MPIQETEKAQQSFSIFYDCSIPNCKVSETVVTWLYKHENDAIWLFANNPFEAPIKFIEQP